MNIPLMGPEAEISAVFMTFFDNFLKNEPCTKLVAFWSVFTKLLSYKVLNLTK